MNKRTTAVIAMACALCLLSSIALAQSGQEGLRKRIGPAERVAAELGEIVVQDGDHFEIAGNHMFAGQGDDTFVFVSSEMSFNGKTVKGAPFSAQTVSEHIQTLADGNRIVHRNTGAIYRDGEGRTRREQQFNMVGPFAADKEPVQTVVINDPVAGVNYILNQKEKTANKRAPLMIMRSGPGTVSITTDGKGEGRGESKTEISTVVVQGGSGEGFAGRMPQIRAGGPHSNAQTNKESLGKQMIEGVEAEGTRETRTIPAGELGNEGPINIVSEAWYSPELQTVVMSRHSDPRFGESTFKLTNISRGEPSASLFQVPSDFVIKEGPGGNRFNIERRRPKEL